MRVLLFLLLLLIWSCSNTASSGGVTETGNAFVSGILVDSLHSGVANHTVIIAPHDADPLSEDSLSFLACTTDNSGKFTSPLISPGEYTLSSRTGSFGFIKSISVTAGIDNKNKENSVGEIPLKQVGSLLFTPPYFSQILPQAVVITGTKFHAFKNENNQYLMDSIPAAIIPSIEGKFDTQNNSLESGINLKEEEFAVKAGALSVLFMVQGDTVGALTENVKRERALLIELGFIVTTENIELLTPDSSNLAEYDLIYGSGSLRWDTDVEMWQKLPLPIATTSTKGYEALGMTDTTDGSYGSREEVTISTMVSKNDPPCIGTNWTTNSTTIPSEGGAIIWGQPASSALKFYQGNVNQLEKFLFTYSKNDEMFNGITAPAGRIALYHRDVEVAQTGRAKNMIYRALLWGMDKF